MANNTQVIIPKRQTNPKLQHWLSLKGQVFDYLHPGFNHCSPSVFYYIDLIAIYPVFGKGDEKDEDSVMLLKLLGPIIWQNLINKSLSSATCR